MYVSIDGLSWTSPRVLLLIQSRKQLLPVWGFGAASLASGHRLLELRIKTVTFGKKAHTPTTMSSPDSDSEADKLNTVSATGDSKRGGSTMHIWLTGIALCHHHHHDYHHHRTACTVLCCTVRKPVRSHSPDRFFRFLDERSGWGTTRTRMAWMHKPGPGSATARADFERQAWPHRQMGCAADAMERW